MGVAGSGRARAALSPIWQTGTLRAPEQAEESLMMMPQAGKGTGHAFLPWDVETTVRRADPYSREAIQKE